MLFVYLAVSIMALIIAVKFFGLYERDVCTILLCWLEGLAERRASRRLHVKDGFNDPSNLLNVNKSHLH